MKYLLGILIASSVYAATIDEQLSTVKATIDSLQKEAWTLESKKSAVVLDSVAQADLTLKSNGIRVVCAKGSPEWVKVALDRLTSINVRLVRASLSEASIQFTLVDADTLSMRRDRAEKALPVISAALKE